MASGVSSAISRHIPWLLFGKTDGFGTIESYSFERETEIRGNRCWVIRCDPKVTEAAFPHPLTDESEFVTKGPVTLYLSLIHI